MLSQKFPRTWQIYLHLVLKETTAEDLNFQVKENKGRGAEHVISGIASTFDPCTAVTSC